LEAPQLSESITCYPIPGDNLVDRPKYFAPGDCLPKKKEALEAVRVYINKTQYLEGVDPEVWEFQVGGYQVCAKWLKDRKGRELSYDDLTTLPKNSGRAQRDDSLDGQNRCGYPGVADGLRESLNDWPRTCPGPI